MVGRERKIHTKRRKGERGRAGRREKGGEIREGGGEIREGGEREGGRGREKVGRGERRGRERKGEGREKRGVGKRRGNRDLTHFGLAKCLSRGGRLAWLDQLVL